MDANEARLDYYKQCFEEANALCLSAQRLLERATSPEAKKEEERIIAVMTKRKDELNSLIEHLSQSVSTSESIEYHGMPNELIEGCPGIPENSVAEKRGMQYEASGQVYKEVLIWGNYGFPTCQNYQQFTRYNVDDDQIDKIKWAAFGKCGSNHRIIRV